MTLQWMGRLPVLLALCLSGAVSMAQTPSPEAQLRVYAAGSLREPLSEIARVYETATGSQIDHTRRLDRVTIPRYAASVLSARTARNQPIRAEMAPGTGATDAALLRDVAR